MTAGNGVQALCGRLAAFGAYRKRWAVLEGLARGTLAGPGALLLWFLLDWAFPLPPWPLFLLFVAGALAGLTAVAVWLVPALARRVRPEREALRVEELHGRLDNLLIGAVELGLEVAGGAARVVHSPALVAVLVERAAGRLVELQPERLLDLRRARRTGAAALVVAAAIAGLLILAPGAVRERAARLQDAWWAVLDTIFPVSLSVEPGSVAVVRGQPVTLRVTAKGARRPGIVLVMRKVDGGAETRVPLTLSGQAAAHTVAAAEDSFEYEFLYARQRSETATIRVGDRPEISAVSFELIYPAYTGQPPRPLSGRVARVQALAGTTVLVSFTATTELHTELSYVEWADGSRQALSVSGRFGHFSFSVEKPDRAVVRLTGRHGAGFESERPLVFEVAVDRDQSPVVQVDYRKDKLVMMAEEAAAFVVPYTAEDDFGVAEVALRYRIDTIDALLGREPREGAVTRLVDPAADRVRGKFAEAFKALDPALQPGDRITIELAAKDNNSESGPGVGRSRPLQIVIVQPDLAQFTERAYGFESAMLLGGLKRLQRATNLLIEPQRMVRTEKEQPVEKQKVEARLNAEAWPSGAEDAVGDYFRLLSGGR